MGNPDGIVVLGTTSHSNVSVEDYRIAALEHGAEIPLIRVHSEDMVFTSAIKKHVPAHWRHVLMLRDGFTWNRNVNEAAAMISLALNAYELDGLMLAQPNQDLPCPGMVLFAPHIVARTRSKPRIRFFKPDLAWWGIKPNLNSFVTRDEASESFDDFIRVLQ